MRPHSFTLWQGALIAFLLYYFLRGVPAGSPRLRYAGAIGSLLAFVASSFLTWAYLEYEPPPRASVAPVMEEPKRAETSSLPELETGNSFNSLSSSPGATDTSSLAKLQGLLMFLWIVGVDIMLIRLSISLAKVKDLQDRASTPNDPALQSQFAALLSRTDSRPRGLRFLVADALPGPVAFGFFRPTIIIPLSLATRTPPELLEAVLAHELAHIRRHDYVINLGQLLIETLFFFNPAVWWINHQIRTEREACCDAEAVRLLGCDTQYASALTDFATSNNLTVTALPFGHENRPGSLIERIRRILIPDYRPTLKLPLPALTLFIIVSSVVLLALHQGSRMAVAVGAEFLSPEARIAKIKAIQESHPTKDPATQYDEALARLPESRVDVRGQIQTHDGSPLKTERLQIVANSERPNYSATYAVNLRNDQFNQRVQPGRIYLSAYSPHYAPTLAGPFHGEIKGSITNLMIEMQAGFIGRIRVTDISGQAVPEAHFSGKYDFPSHTPITEGLTDASGIGFITNAITHPLKLTVRAPGFEEDQQTITLSQEHPIQWQLEPASPATIIVQDEKGKRVEGAEARLVATRGFRNMSYSGESSRLCATSNADGVLRLDELRSDTKYWFLIQADGYGKRLIPNVTAGETERVIELQEPFSVKGTFRGELSLLRMRSRWEDGIRTQYPSIRYRNPYRVHDYSDFKQETLELQIEGDQAHFEIEDLWPGEITIYAGALEVTRELEQGETLIDLFISGNSQETVGPTAPTHPLPQRTIEIRFESPEGHPTPSGDALAVLSLKQPNGTFDHEERQVSVNKGLAKLSVPVGSQIRLEPDNFTGYWFETHYERDIAQSAEPLSITVPCFPAGAIYGRVQEANGEPAKGVMISLVECERAPQRPHTSLDVDIKNSSSSTDITKQYTATPLPIGGTYMIVAHRGATYALSEEIKITKENPIAQADLILRLGITVKGRVVLPDGSPGKGIRYSHSFTAHPNHGFSSGDHFTDRLGRFEIHHVVPDIGKGYSIRFADNPGIQMDEIRYDPNHSEVKVVLKAGHTFTGMIVDHETGWPIPGAEIYALPHPYSPDRLGHLEADNKTDESGRFRFTTLDGGDYRLGIRGGQFRSTDKLIIHSNQDSKEPFRVELSEWSRLVPSQPDTRAAK